MKDTAVAAPARLKRSLGGLGIMMLTLSVLSPASSVFISGNDIIHTAGTGAALAFVIGSLIVFNTQSLYAELGASFPLAGGEYAYIGNVLGPLPGFLVLFVNILSAPLFISFTASGVADYLQPVWPQVSPGLVTTAAILIAVGVAVLNIRTNAWVTGIFLAVEVAALLLVASLGLLHPVRDMGTVFLHPRYTTPDGLMPPGLGGLAIAANSAAYALSGASQAVYFSEEMKAPHRVGHWVMIILGVTVLLEVPPVLGLVFGTYDLSTFRTPAPFIAYLATATPPWVATAISLAIALAIFNAVIAAVVAYSRMMFSTGRDRIWWPSADRWLLHIDPRLHSPVNATLLLGGLCLMAMAVPPHLKLIMLADLTLSVFILLAFSVFKARRDKLTGHGGRYLAPWFPLTPVVTIALTLAIGISQMLDPADGRQAMLALFGTLIMGALYYFTVLKRRPGGWSPTAPETN